MEKTAFHDVLIVGAGISGISMAAHLGEMCPQLSYTILEKRARLGGTWDLFRYPGVRSDSDMHTLGFSFAPWGEDEAIAGGDKILSYLQEVASERAITPNIRFGQTVISADWRADECLWRVTIADGQGTREETARFLYLASGYYDYEEPHDAQLPGLSDFGGQVAHPQFWPETLDFSGKQVVVIGSGATAVTIVPAMAETAAHVTMLQRTPTWMVAQPSQDKWANRLRALLPEKAAWGITRWINIRLGSFVFRYARSKPQKFGNWLTKSLRKHLGDAYQAMHFTPPYGPWEQRLCVVPDGDLFDAIKSGEASIVTAQIDRVEKSGVRLEDGALLPADILVTATGLKLSLGGKIAVSLNGAPVHWKDHFFYRSAMFSNIPNLAIVFGYLNASWTLRADNSAKYACRVLQEMDKQGAKIATPHLPESQQIIAVEPFDYSSGYLQRAADDVPQSAGTLPWRLNQDYLEDCRDLRTNPVDDGILLFTRDVAHPSKLP